MILPFGQVNMPICHLKVTEKAQEKEDAVIQVYRKYSVDWIENKNWCPFARMSREGGHTKEVVCWQTQLDLKVVLSALESMGRHDKIEVGFLIFPLLNISRVDFVHFVQKLRQAHQHTSPPDASGQRFVMAAEAFHPEVVLDLSSATRLIPFLRATPDPTIQLVRHRVLESVKKGKQTGTGFFDPNTMSLEKLLSTKPEPSVSDKITESNYQTALKMGEDLLIRRHQDMMAYRNTTYGQVGLPLRT